MTGLRSIAADGPPASRVVAPIGIGALAVVLGAALAYGKTPLVLAVALLIVIALGWRHLPYAVPATLLVLTLNGVPFLDLETFAVPGSFQPVDITIIGLILIAAGRMAFGEPRSLGRFQRFLWIWSPIFLLVWLVATIRGVDAGASLLKASLFGRDFLYFAILAPLAGYLFANREDSRRFCLIVGAWTGLFSVLLILSNLQVIDPSVVNASLTAKTGFVTRIYTPMSDLVVVTFTLSLAYALIEAGPRRRWATLLAMLTGLAAVLALTRALYIGMTIGLIAAVGIWILRSGVSGQRLRRRLALTVAGLGVITVIALGVFPQIESGPVGTVGDRVGSSVTALTQNVSTETGNTFTYRKRLSSEMLRYLGGRWALGLGFVPPSTRYVAGLPAGTIRNPDVGLLNGVMTMGVLGTILLYVPLFLLLGMLFQRSAERLGPWSFVWFGLVFWGVSVLVGSITLITLYSRTGLALTALILGYAGQAMLFSEAPE
jgi:O-Antigen ligase